MAGKKRTIAVLPRYQQGGEAFILEDGLYFSLIPTGLVAVGLGLATAMGKRGCLQGRSQRRLVAKPLLV